MSPSSAGNRNRAISHAVRGLVASFMRSEGFDAVAKAHISRISEGIDAALDPDIAGIDGVHIDVSSRVQHRLSEDLDDARRTAAINGRHIAALVQYRPSRDVEQSFVVMGLDHFSKLLRDSGHSP